MKRPKELHVAPQTRPTTSARSLVSDRDTKSPMANCRFSRGPGRSERRAARASWSRILPWNAANSISGRKRRGRRLGDPQCEDLRGKGPGSAANAPRDRQRIECKFDWRTRTRAKGVRCFSLVVPFKVPNVSTEEVGGPGRDNIFHLPECLIRAYIRC